MAKTFRTRKRGTPRQIGKKFPVMEKKKLPAKISMRGKARQPQYAAVKRNEKAQFEIVKYFKTYQDAVDWAYTQKIDGRSDPGIKIIGKNLFKNFPESKAAWKQKAYETGETDAPLWGAISFKKEGDKIKSKGKFDPVYEEYLVELGKGRKISFDEFLEERGKKLRKFGGKIKPKKFRKKDDRLFKQIAEAETVTIEGKKYIKPNLSKYSPTTRHFDPIKKEYLTLKQSKTAGLIPVVSEEEKKALRILRRDPGVRAEERLKRRRLEDSQYLQYLKDMGVSKKIIDVNRQMMKRQIAEKIRVVKYPVEKRGPSYQRYLQKLRDKRAAKKAEKLKR